MSKAEGFNGKPFLFQHPCNQTGISKRLINGAAVAILGVFVPIFLYETTGENFYVVGTFYAFASLGYVLAIVPGVQLMNIFGYKKSLVVGAIFTVLTYVILFFMTEVNIYLLLGPLLGVIVLNRVFHWVPYHVDFAEFTKAGERGRNVSLTYATIAFLGIIGPILAGYIIDNSGYSVLFAIAIILMVIATVSYSFVPETYEKFTWSFKETWYRLFSHEYRSMAFGKFASGVEKIITLIAWPIFLYEILNGNVFEIGAVATFVTAVTVLVQISLGGFLDKWGRFGKEHTLKIGSLLYAVGWVIKIFVLSIVQIFFVGLYHNVTKIFTKTPFDALFYDMSADQGRYVDEFTVLSEMADHLGRFTGLLIVVGLTMLISIKWTFIIGAIAAIFFNLIYKAVKN